MTWRHHLSWDICYSKPPNGAESTIVRSTSEDSSFFAYRRQIIVVLVLQRWILLSALSFCVAQARLDISDVPKRVAEAVIRNYIEALRTTFLLDSYFKSIHLNLAIFRNFI
jgi:hypothetical protein